MDLMSRVRNFGMGSDLCRSAGFVTGAGVGVDALQLDWIVNFFSVSDNFF